jgi:hypothetical protein
LEDTGKKIVIHDPAVIGEMVFTIRGMQVMIDRDLASLYQVETRALKQAVKRNIKRFPGDFMFELTNDEINNLVSQSVIPSKQQLGGAKPFVFTEQGVAILSSVLTSDRAIEINILIMRAFVKMRKFIQLNANIFHRLDTIEKRQFKHEIETNEKFEKVFNALQSKEIEPKQGIFFNGQIFDAYKFVSGLVRKAKKSIILIDNYIDETVLDLFSKKRKKVKVTILTGRITRALRRDVEKFNAQYPTLELKEFTLSHDRFLIIDDKDVYHFGASLKDLGKKWFAFSKMDKTAFAMMDNLKKVVIDE